MRCIEECDQQCPLPAPCMKELAVKMKIRHAACMHTSCCVRVPMLCRLSDEALAQVDYPMVTGPWRRFMQPVLTLLRPSSEVGRAASHQ